MSKSPNSSLKSLIKRRAQSVMQFKAKKELPLVKTPKEKSFDLYSRYLPKAPKQGTSKYLQCPAQYSQVFEWTATLNELSTSVFNHPSIKEIQNQIINASLHGNDIMVILPTGSGKTLTYQLPGLVCKGITIVVSPLLSLISDQINKLRMRGIPSLDLSSNQSIDSLEQALNRLENDPQVKFVYITPERIVGNDRILKILHRMYLQDRIARLVVDEAQCICHWGFGFRPDYLQIKAFRINCPTVPIIALTASATISLRNEISALLMLKNPILFTSSLNRPNLVYEVREKNPSVNKDIGNFINNTHFNECGIIYCNFIKDCEFLSRVLKYNYKISCGVYHGELSNDKKNKVFSQWVNNEIKVMVATFAFGLGIDKENVRFIINYSIPESLDIYYQETGRAGRDGNNSSCILYYQYEDKQKIIRLLNKDSEELYKVFEYCENKSECRRKVLLEYFGENITKEQCGYMCDNCVNPKSVKTVDVSDIVMVLIRDLSKRFDSFGTAVQITEVLLGNNHKQQAHLKEIPSHGLLKNWSKKNIEKLLRMCIIRKVFREEMYKTAYATYARLTLGQYFDKVLRGDLKIFMDFKSEIGESPNKGENDNENSEIVEKFKILRKKISKNLKISEGQVISDETLESIAKELPDVCVGVPQEFVDEIKEIKKEKIEKDYQFSLNFDEIDYDEFQNEYLKRQVNCSGITNKQLKDT